MIILTGDVHHMSMKTCDQSLLKGFTELEVTEEYLKIANKYNIKPLLFLTGRLAIEESSYIKKLIKNYKFDIGGHTYYAYSGLFRKYYYGILKKIFKLANGTTEIQKKDIIKTLEVYKKFFNKEIIAWRNHAYRTDKNTNFLLSEAGIRFVSNEVNTITGPKFLIKNLWELPINTLPDHENLKHSNGNSTKLSINQWVDILKEELLANQNSDLDSVVLAHPACMYIEDKFSKFEELCNFIGKNNVASLSDLCKKYK